MFTPCYDWILVNSSLYDHLAPMTCNSLYALVNNALSLCMIMDIIALLVGLSQSIASLHLYWVWSLLVHPTPKKPKFCQMCPLYLPNSLLLFQSRFSALSSFKPKMLYVKIVSKALTNLMAHFIFLLIRSLNHCDYLMVYMPVNYELKVGTTMLSWGTLSTPRLFLILSWYHVSFVFGCLPVWNKLVNYESMEFVYVLEKRLSRQPKPRVMVEIYSIP